MFQFLLFRWKSVAVRKSICLHFVLCGIFDSRSQFEKQKKKKKIHCAAIYMSRLSLAAFTICSNKHISQLIHTNSKKRRREELGLTYYIHADIDRQRDLYACVLKYKYNTRKIDVNDRKNKKKRKRRPPKSHIFHLKTVHSNFAILSIDFGSMNFIRFHFQFLRDLVSSKPPN